MRPLRLTMQALGPYAGVQKLDFSQLEGRNLFLISGPTGAGKSTILDAMCFGLYGDGKSSERTGTQMRSHHAEPGVMTEVTFDFAIGQRAYRVWRRPEQSRPKKVGEGMTTERPDATLWELDVAGQVGKVLASGWQDVSAEAIRRTGFQGEQFRQVVLLPQGKFRDFLLASSTEREKILETLFQTELYRAITDRLKTRAAGLAERFQQLRQQRQALLSQADLPDEDALDRALADARSQSDTHRDAMESLRQADRQAADALQAGRAVQAKFAEHAEAVQALAELDARRDEIHAKRQRLARARQAHTLTDADGALAEAAEIRDSANIAVEQAETSIADLKARRDTAARELKAAQSRQADADALRKRLAQLEGLADAETKLTEARKEHDDAQTAEQRTRQHLDQAEEQLKQLQTDIEAAEERRDELDAQAGQLDRLRQAHQQAEKLAELRSQLDEARQQLRRHQADSKDTARKIDRLVDARAEKAREAEDLEARWRTGQAGILAESLQPQTPCPVCGSTDHPAPARRADDVPDESALNAARHELVRLDRHLEVARARQSERAIEQAGCRSRAEAMEGQLGEDADTAPAELAGRAEQAAQQIAQAEKARQRSIAAEQELARLATRFEKARAEAENASRKHADAVAQATRTGERVREREQALPEDLRTPEALGEAMLSARRQLKEITYALEQAQAKLAKLDSELAAATSAHASARKNLQDAQARLADKQADFADRLAQAGFDTRQAYQAARLEPEQQAQLEQEIQTYESRRSAAADRADRAGQAIDGLKKPHLDALQAAADKARAAVDAALTRQTELNERIGQLQKLAERLARAGTDAANVEAEHATVGRLAEVAGGKNALGVSFERFVLGALLDDVLVAASQRLRIMSRGRFELHRRRERTDRRTAAGLDLDVYDAYTGQDRPVQTLSGGESFLAALSLALGLADVVQAYSGGIHLETVFIDEGFGSLDSESLDLALRALVEIQSAGRLVGIISHVGELAQRMDARLEVQPGRNGSQAHFIVG